MASTPKTAARPLYRVAFLAGDKRYEVYVRKVASAGAMLGFLELEGFVFGERSSVLVDPAEEKLKDEFGEVRRCFVPLHAVLRVDEVAKRGTARITAVEGGAPSPVAFLPVPPTRK